MMKKPILIWVFAVFMPWLDGMAQTTDYKQVWTADQGDGTYVNPIINADFPDPDVIRVDDTYYLASTTMYHFPGATILKSKDLVNWEYCANPLKMIVDNDAYNLMNGKHHYSQGMWASSLQYHEGKFYFYFPCSTWSEDSRSLLLTAEDPEGEWEVTQLPECYHDPGWLFDDGEDGDGFLYVVCGIGDLWVNKFNAKTLKKLSSTKVASVGNGCEGSHMYHIGDYYYIYSTYGGTEGSQTIFRSKNPMGPYEEHDGRVFANQNIHQGALVQTQTGEWWTILFKDIYWYGGAIGRMPCLEPVTWQDGWPIIGNKGTDVSKNGKGYKKPDVGQTYEKTYLPTNDAFVDETLGMQWEWNHQPDNTAWSLTERPGYLRLYTANVTDELNTAHNSLSQRILGYSPSGTASGSYKNSYGTVKMDLTAMQEGDVAGIAVFQNPYSFVGVKMVNGKKKLYSERCTFGGQTLKKVEAKTGVEVKDDIIYLRATVNFGTNSCKYSYSYDNKKWTNWGVTMTMGYTLDYFVGQRFYLFNYATKHLGGYVDFDWFTTEQEYTEEMFGISSPQETLTEADRTMVSLSTEQSQLSVLAGGVQPMEVTCVFESGLKRNVAASCTYTVTHPDIVTVVGGHLMGRQEGETDVTATYTDAKGLSESVVFHVTVAYFPLTAESFNPSLSGVGTFHAKIASVKTAENGLAGWRYPAGVDWSNHQYLVIRLMRGSTCSPSFRIYDEDNTSVIPYICEIGSSKEVVIPLHEMKSEEGKTIDPSHIHLAAFSSTGANSIYIKEVFLSDDGTTPTDILVPEVMDESLGVLRHQSTGLLYDLTGRPVAHPTKGVYLMNGRKMLVP